MGNRIRILLLILTVLFLTTAITINNIVTKEDMLELDTRTLSNNLHRSEELVDQFFADSSMMKAFQNVEIYPTQALDITKKIGAKERIFFFVYKNHQPIFWSTNLFVPVNDLGFQSDVNYIKEDNRHLVVKKKVLSDNSSLLAIIPIKADFPFTNQYLENIFNVTLLKSDNLAIADYTDTENIKNIYSNNGSYLFSVKLSEGKHDNIFINIQFICWIFASLCFLIFVHNVSYMTAKNGRPWLSIAFFALILMLTRYVDLKTNWLASQSSLGLFNPKYYAFSPILPNLWAFLMTTFFVIWFVFYVRSVMGFLKFPEIWKKPTLSGLIALASILSIYFVSNLLFYHLSTLITNSSQVSLDFTQLLSFDTYSWINTLIFCVNMVILLYFIDTIVGFLKNILPNTTSFLNLQLIALVTAIILNAIIIGENTFFNIFLAGVIMLRAYSNMRMSLNLPTFILTLVFLAFMATSVYMRSVHDKVEQEMKVTVGQLEAEDDFNALALFVDLEKDILKDEQLKQLFTISLPNTQTDIINQYLKTHYFSGYLSKFEFNSYYYYDQRPLEHYNSDKIEEYREKVINNSTKVPQTQNFYRVRSELGTHEYFLQFEIPIVRNGKEDLVQVYLNFKNKAFNASLNYPVILADSRSEFINKHKQLASSFALYRDGYLVTQNGSFTYPNRDDNFASKIGQYTNNENYNGYFHVIYRPDNHTSLVVSTPQLNFWQSIAIFSFLFLSLYTFFLFFNFIRYVSTTVTRRAFNFNSVKYHFKLLVNRVQYSTRIQTMIVGVVIFAIVISGLITFISISYQLEKDSVEQRQKYILDVVNKIESLMQESPNLDENRFEDILQKLSETSVTDFNLYDKNGKLRYTSQPRIYDMELISTYINPTAFNNLNIRKKTDLFLKEKLVKFEYNSSFAAIRNNDYNTVLFLNIPYFTTAEQENASQNLLLNTLLNIYTIIILAFGFFTVLVANSITKPLSLIGRKLSETIFSNKPNEPLYWERDDEIGALIKEYNYMIVKLEENAKQLMNAEREYAWREMAKQIAHEIKNPLTPMKLGIQQLSRSYREGDPRFEERFYKFSNSFIEQINSLSKIATEFSNFAKLPDTNLTKINIIEKINKSANVYHNTHNTYIKVINNTDQENIYVLGDKDQLLRTFNNLLKNSLEASITRKKHLISVLVDYADEKHVRILLKDNGLGIPSELVPKIFQPNFTTKSSGTGLGLAFVKKTVESMKGQISFTTFEGIGTTFTIILPLYNEEMLEG